MNEPEYARSKYLTLHRWASCIIVLLFAIVYGFLTHPVLIIAATARFIIPLAIIWFSDDLASWAVEASGGLLKANNSDKYVRLVGWIILVILLIIRFYVLSLD